MPYRHWHTQVNISVKHSPLGVVFIHSHAHMHLVQQSPTCSCCLLRLISHLLEAPLGRRLTLPPLQQGDMIYSLICSSRFRADKILSFFPYLLQGSCMSASCIFTLHPHRREQGNGTVKHKQFSFLVFKVIGTNDVRHANQCHHGPASTQSTLSHCLLSTAHSSPVNTPLA